MSANASVLSLALSVLVLWACAPKRAPAQTFATLYSFSFTNYANGAGPAGNLAIDANGVLYGATQAGGAHSSCTGGQGSGCGTVYSLTPPISPGGAWTEKVLWSFGATSTDAYNPAGLTMGVDGILYGVAGGGEFGYGSVFSLIPPASPGGDWTESVLWRFAGPPDGELEPFPASSLVIDSSGTLYGTTYFGGSSSACFSGGCGTVFALAPPATQGGNWTESVLWSFGSGGDGTHPLPYLALGAGGVIYGVTQMGGRGNNGIVFSLTPPSTPGSPWIESVIHDFPHSAEERPAAIALGAGGTLYGTTILQKKGEQGGTVFSLAPPVGQGRSWTMATLFRFPARDFEADVSDQPNGELFIDKKTGALFGATGDGHGRGTLFELAPPSLGATAWTLHLLYHGVTDASLNPVIGLKSVSMFYGTDTMGDLVWSLVP